MVTTKKFNNGLKIIHEKNDNVRSVAVGIFVGAGSAYEDDKCRGISHFIEHMLFKGTTTRSAYQIADTIESIGAQVNAFTSKQVTAYYTVSIDEHAEECIEILSDILFNSTFETSEMDKEKGVVLEEIAMYEDTPDEVCLELLSSIIFEGNPLGKPILGYADTVKSFDKAMIEDYMHRYYNANNIVISVVGNIEFSVLEQLVNKYFINNFINENQTYEILVAHKIVGDYKTKIKSIEQSNIAIAFPSFKFDDSREPEILLLSSLLGGSMSSRLFQVIREQMGAAYSVYTYPSSYINNGYFTIFLGTNPSKACDAVKAVKSELNRLKKDGVLESELNRAKEQIKSGLLMGQESTRSMMSLYGKFLLLADKPYSLNEKAEIIASVNINSVTNIIDYIFDYDKVSISYVGPEINANLKDVFLNHN